MLCSSGAYLFATSVLEKRKYRVLKLYDLIIIGLGSMGSATAYYTTLSGLEVLGLDQSSPPHNKGSHTGGSRIIRKAYFEDPDYVPILARAYKNWTNLEELTQEKHFHKTGLLYFGQSCETLISGVLQSAEKYDIPIKKNTQAELRDSYPMFRIPNDYVRLKEPEAGYIDTHQTIQSYQNLALTLGCKIYKNTKVIHWQYKDEKILVATENGEFLSKKLIITAGAWTRPLLKHYLPDISLKTTRQSYFYYQPKNQKLFKEGSFPCWNIQPPHHIGLYYGFPYKPKDSESKEYGLKLAHHHPASVINPDELLAGPSLEEQNDAFKILQTYIPEAAGKLIKAGSCIYTYSTDEDFIIDYIEGTNRNVVLACGFSGHGFKFVPAMGELLSDMITNEQKAKELEFLSLERFKN